MSSSSVSFGVVGDRGLPLKCVCGLDVTIFTSKTAENPGRPFFRCISKKDPHTWNNKRDGHLFKWVEDAVYEEVEDALPRVAIIANELSKAKSEVIVLNGIVEELKEEALVSKSAIRKLQVFLTMCLVWLFVMTIMIVYIVFGQAKENGNPNKIRIGY